MDHSLIVTISHIVTDGSGFKQLLYLLCDCYNGCATDNLPSLQCRDLSCLTKHTNEEIHQAMQLLASMKSDDTQSPLYQADNSAPVWVLEKIIPQDAMKQTHERSKKQGATLNDVFLTAYARCLGRLWQAETVNLPCTVDLRKYVENPVVIANMTGSYHLHLSLDLSEPFVETLNRVTSSMQAQKRTLVDLAGPMHLISQYRTLPLSQFTARYGSRGAVVPADYTNLGMIDHRRLTFDGLTVRRAVGYSSVNHSSSFQLAVSSFAGETTLTSLIRCAKEDETVICNVHDVVAAEIYAFAKASSS